MSTKVVAFAAKFNVNFVLGLFVLNFHRSLKISGSWLH